MRKFISIFAGLLRFDPIAGKFQNLILIISRFTWEIPQTFLGMMFVLTMHATGKVSHVAYFGACTFLILVQNSNRRQGISLGNFIYVQHYSDQIDFSNDPLLLHEYGHHVQSRRWGLLYLIVIGLPSLISILRSKSIGHGLSTHDLKWYELQANRLAAITRQKYFGKNWTEFEPPHRGFPTRRPAGFT